jgi:DNA adenine methylase
LIIFRDEKKDRLESLLRNARETRIGAIPLSSEEIINLLQQHLQSPSASRIPVLIVAAAYESAGILIGEKALPLESHNAADKQTGSVGDVEVVLINDISVVSGYEMKDKKITIADIDIAVGKIVSKKEIQNYIFITTEPIGENIREYASSWYEKIGGKEIVVLECISFVRHFLHFFSRHRERFLERYEELLLSEADSSVPQILKETWLTLRQAAEFRPEHRTDA